MEHLCATAPTLLTAAPTPPCSSSSPVTQVRLAHTGLVPNPGVKAAVVDYLRAQLAVPPPQ